MSALAVEPYCVLHSTDADFLSLLWVEVAQSDRRLTGGLLAQHSLSGVPGAHLA